MRRARRSAPGRSKRPRFSLSWAGHGPFPHHRHRRRRHRRADRSAGADARGLPRRRAGAGRAVGGGRRRHPAFTERHARAVRSRACRAAAPARGRAGRDPRRQRRIGARHRARAARRDGGEPLRRALLGDPPRRPAGGAGDHDRGKSGCHLAARHARRGFRDPPAWRDGRGARRSRACATSRASR